MANGTMAEHRAALYAAGMAPVTSTRQQFCAQVSISEGTYGKMKRKMKAAMAAGKTAEEARIIAGLPKETWVEGVCIISHKHRDEWLEERAAESLSAA